MAGMVDIFPPRRRLLPTSIMARRLRVTVRWLREEAEAGRVPCIKAERQFLFDAEAVEEVLLQRARVGSSTEDVDVIV